MGRRDRTVAVNEVRHSAGGAGWPAALAPAPQRGATFKKVAALFTNFSTRMLCARGNFCLRSSKVDRNFKYSGRDTQARLSCRRIEACSPEGSVRHAL